MKKKRKRISLNKKTLIIFILFVFQSIYLDAQFSNVIFKDSVICSSKNVVVFELIDSLCDANEIYSPSNYRVKKTINCTMYDKLSTELSRLNKNHLKYARPELNPYLFDDYVFQVFFIQVENRTECIVNILVKNIYENSESEPISVCDGGYSHSTWLIKNW